MLSTSTRNTYFKYHGILATPFDKYTEFTEYTEDALAIFTSSGMDTVFENVVGFRA